MSSQPPILVVVRASPIRDRTAAVLDSIRTQEPAGLARTVVLTLRDPKAGPEFGIPGVEEIPAEADWQSQVLKLSEASGCQWIVVPSSVDAYLPGAFEAVVRTGPPACAAVIGGCRVRRDDSCFSVGPAPFRFDYFALLAGFNYVAPGCTFMAADTLGRTGGLDPRFPNAALYEYLLRVGAAHGVATCGTVLLETDAAPFPGIPADYALCYAAEALLVALSYQRFWLAPGTSLGLVATLAERLAPFRHAGFYDERLAGLLPSAGTGLKDRYLQYLGFEEIGQGCGQGEAQGPGVPPTDWTGERQVRWTGEGMGPELLGRGWAFSLSRADRVAVNAFADSPTVTGAAVSRHNLRSRIRAVTPQPIWGALRRAKRAWKAFRDPLD